MAADHVILDAGAVIACSDLASLGRHFYSTSAVLAEVRDQNARLRLELLPAPVVVREPCEPHIQRVVSMAKASGDIGVLSLPDIGIAALALELMEEFGGCNHPAEQQQQQQEDEEQKPVEDEQLDEDNEGEEEDDEESGWVTQDNLSRVLGGATVQPAAAAAPAPRVACASTDFAVQNVCAKLGVPIVACDGRLIAEIRTHVLWCAACFKRCLRQDRRFCPACGNATLHRISASLDAGPGGQLKLYFKRNYQYRLKGTRYSLPKPRGGKHSLDPVVCEWQRVPQQRPTKKAIQRANPLAEGDADQLRLQQQGGSGPGLFAQHDLSSRAAVLGIKGGLPHWGRRNPNENGRRTGSSAKGKRRK